MKIKILKTAVSYLQSKESLTYERAILKISRVIQTGECQNNPVLKALIDAELSADPVDLHGLMTPAA